MLYNPEAIFPTKPSGHWERMQSQQYCLLMWISNTKFDRVLSFYFLMRFSHHQCALEPFILRRFYRWRFRGSGSMSCSRLYIDTPQNRNLSLISSTSGDFSTLLSPSSHAHHLSPGLLQWLPCWFLFLHSYSFPFCYHQVIHLTFFFEHLLFARYYSQWWIMAVIKVTEQLSKHPWTWHSSNRDFLQF